MDNATQDNLVMDNEVKEQFNLNEDFIFANSILSKTSAREALQLMQKEAARLKEKYSKNPNNWEKDINNNLITLMHRLVSRNINDLTEYYRYISKISEYQIRDVFFIRASDSLEKNILNNYEHMKAYLNCFQKECLDITQKIINFKNLNLTYNYVNYLKTHRGFDLSVAANPDLIFQGFSNQDIATNLIRFSRIFNKRITSQEKVLFEENNEFNLLEYANTWKDDLIKKEYLESAIDTALSRKENALIDFKNMEIYHGILYASINLKDRFQLPRMERLENLFKREVEREDEFASNILSYLHFYTAHSFNTDNKFLDGIQLISLYISKMHKSKVWSWLEILYQLYAKLFACCNKKDIPRINISDVEVNLLLYLFNGGFGDVGFSYAENFNLIGTPFLDNIIASTDNHILFYDYAMRKNSRFLAGEKTIVLRGSVCKLTEYSNKFDCLFEDHEEFIQKLYNYSADEVINYLIKYIRKNVLLPKLSDKLQKKIIKNTDFSLTYVQATGQRFLKFENKIYKQLKELKDSFATDFSEHGLLMFSDLLAQYKAYCAVLKNKVFVKRIEECLFGINFPLECVEVRKELIDYVLKYVKMPSKIFDNSIIGNDPDYLKLKEDYVKERTANRKRQRRKSLGDDTQGQSQGGSGDEAPVG